MTDFLRKASVQAIKELPPIGKGSNDYLSEFVFRNHNILEEALLFYKDHCVENNSNPLEPDMPVQELLLHMGEMTQQEIRTARSAIRWANNRKSSSDGFTMVENGKLEHMKMLCEKWINYTEEKDKTFDYIKGLMTEEPSGNFIALYSDGSGAEIFKTTEGLFIDSDGDVYTQTRLLEDHLSHWIPLPESYVMWMDRE